MDFRSRLREAIEYAGMLDKEVAAKANITKRTIDSYVGNNPSMPAADVAVRLAKVLNTTVEYLVDGSEPDTFPSLAPATKLLIETFQELNERDKKLLIHIAKDLKETK